MATTESIVLVTPNSEAKIILDWDDGQWYISDIQPNTGGSSGSNTGGTTNNTAQNSGVKVPEWDQSYKYAQNDIVAYKGTLYVSGQNTNQGHKPNLDKFWWHPIIDLTSVDAITLEGKNLTEIIRSVLGGNSISDYYKKSEIDNIILNYFNNVNAKKLNDWSLQNIKDDYNSLIRASESKSEQNISNYITNESPTGFDQSLVNLFNSSIALDTVNKF